jgi:hypothetical protein
MPAVCPSRWRARIPARGGGGPRARGCGAAAKPTRPSPARQRAALASYLRAVEPIRLGVNRLLEGADPILSAYDDHHISAKLAAQRMEALERRFAAYTVQMAAIEPADRLHVRLPADLQAAGRGEIAPSPDGS